MLELITNPIIVSVILLCTLCLARVNVLLALIVSAIVAGKIAGMHAGNIMDVFINGMGKNSETALSYILLGTFAAAMAHTGLADVLAKRISLMIKNKKFILLLILTLLACASQNLIPVHIAFIPVIIPPLLAVMNKLKLDRRAVACSLAFGLVTPYIVFPAGFGLIFQRLLADNMTANGMQTDVTDIWKSVWFIGIGLLAGLLYAVFVSYRKPREYEDKEVKKRTQTFIEIYRKPLYNVACSCCNSGCAVVDKIFASWCINWFDYNFWNTGNRSGKNGYLN